MRERAILDQQLSQLESEKESIEDGIKEINRRLAVLDEVEGWILSTEPSLLPVPGSPLGPTF